MRVGVTAGVNTSAADRLAGQTGRALNAATRVATALPNIAFM
jgi:hypothetical protein